MMHSAEQRDGAQPAPNLDDAAGVLRILETLRTLGDAPDEETALEHFEEALWFMGADAAVFLSYTREDATRDSFRWLLACDPLWAVEYAKNGWHQHDPWLRHALHGTEPVSDAALSVRPDEQDFINTSATLGFASAAIVPAPSDAGTSRVGMLSLGSHVPGYFTEEVLCKVRVLCRALAMELHRWMLQSMRTELLRATCITPAELELLRLEEAGQTSKHIGSALNIKATTVDCRFQKVITKLKVPDRRTAARVARLYGLL